MANERVVLHASDMHAHDFYEIALVVSGHGWHVCGSRRSPLDPGDVVLINPVVPHAYVVHGNAPFVVRNVVFTEAVLAGAADHPEMAGVLDLFLGTGGEYGAAHFRSLTNPLNGCIQPLNIAATMVREYNERDAGYRMLLYGHLLILLATLWRVGNSQESPQSPSTAVWQRIFPAVHRLLDGDTLPDAGLPALAASCGWSSGHFRKQFKAATGQTVRAFLRHLRVRRAAALLLSTPLGLDEVALRVGYADGRALRRAFVACFGIAPDTFRRGSHP